MSTQNRTLMAGLLIHALRANLWVGIEVTNRPLGFSMAAVNARNH